MLTTTTTTTSSSSSSTSSTPTPDDHIIFPHHPLFKLNHPNLLSFDDYIPSGIFVTTPSSSDVQSSQPTTDEQFTFPTSLETDSFLIPTLNLLIPHSINRPHTTKKRTNANVTRVSKEDAWKLGKDGLEEEEWKEPVGSWKGVFGLEKRPFDRALRALEQFLNSRSLALNRQVHYPIVRQFRNATLLQPSNSGPHIPGPISLPPGSQIPEEEENCLFLIDMEGCLQAYWRKVMEEGGRGWNVKTAYDSFEIVNSFLHYLSLAPFLPEPIFSLPLHRILPISRLYLLRMFCAGMIYQHFGCVGTREGWIGLVTSTWVRNVTEEWKDEGWKKLGEELEEEKEEVGEEKQAVGDWEKLVAESPDKVIAALSTKQATIKMQPLIAPSLVKNFKCTQIHSTAIGIITSASIATPSTSQLPFPCIQDLIRLEIDVQPAAGEPPIKATVFIDRSPEMITYAKGIDSIVDAAVGLKVVGTFAEVKGVRDDGEEVGFWVITDVEKVSPPSADE